MRTKRYWYYTSKASWVKDGKSAERLPANEIERLVLNSLDNHLSDKTWLADQVTGAEGQGSDVPVSEILQAAETWCTEIAISDGDTITSNFGELINRIDVQMERLCIQLNLNALLSPNASCASITMTIEVPYQKSQNGRSRPIVIAPEGTIRRDLDLITLVADARRWAGEVLEGKTSTIRQIEEREGLRSGSVSRVLPLAWLAPDITTAILAGRQPLHLNAKTCVVSEICLWTGKQRQILGFPQL